MFLKGHLFGDIFGRDVLDFKTREIATIAALSTLDGVEGQLRSHLNVGRKTGLTEGQLRSLLAVIRDRVDPLAAARAEAVLENAPARRDETSGVGSFSAGHDVCAGCRHDRDLTARRS